MATLPYKVTAFQKLAASVLVCNIRDIDLKKLDRLTFLSSEYLQNICYSGLCFMWHSRNIKFSLTLCVLAPSTDIICKQFRPRSGLTAFLFILDFRDFSPVCLSIHFEFSVNGPAHYRIMPKSLINCACIAILWVYFLIFKHGSRGGRWGSGPLPLKNHKI